ncbi:MAG: Octanoyltransferase LipM [Chlamydiia bacterium]|nr:Octanoyltransferase LipM [Chlamydiia bacterium]MCH9618741.1 Octanoyltransferase LipM [Chlamydiia bacterium]MCH9624519.1 Octanoyltransferase LipM [Chlamydiia bacterium]
MWKVINSGKKNASFLMEKDEKLLVSMKKEDAPILHFYDFVKPSFTFGVFVKPEQIMNQKNYIKDFDFSRRPTGGGVLFHLWDFAFSCFVPKDHPGYFEDVMDSYKYINDKVILALSDHVKEHAGEFTLLPEEPVPHHPDCKNFCFAKPTKFDIMLLGKKIGGAAQRRKEGGYLHQGSISLIMPDFNQIAPLFHNDSAVLSAMKLHTHPLLGHKAGIKELEAAKNALIHSFEKVFK